ncbi:5-oxoprolinase subunit PxpB [Macrococcus carouselicus]|nr:5-oxoprolinase subunit PxpB [Macrococcus carouselicus]
MKIRYISENALVCNFDSVIDSHINRRVLSLKHEIEALNIHGVEEMVTSYSTLVIYFNDDITHDTLAAQIKQLKLEQPEGKQAKVFTIPVCYEDGLDLEELAAYCKVSPAEVIERHTSRQYLIYMLGFMPGFPFLGGLDPAIAKPRKETPRKEIPAGSVGIANEQTGMYPISSPGGWNIIGRTPVKLFDTERTPSVYYEAGDYIQFRAISKEEYTAIEQNQNYRIEVKEIES